MNYYSFHIGDYASHTRGLTLLEDLAYRRLLDAYYLSEAPLAGDANTIAKMIGMPDSVADVKYILDHFFILCVYETKDVFCNRRADREIARYREIVEQRVAAGRASAMRRQQALSDRSTGVEQSNIQNPESRIHDDIKSGGKPRRAATGRQLPDDFKANQDHQDMAVKLQLDIETEFAQFRDHHLARGTVMKSWDAAFRTWLRNAYRFRAAGTPGKHRWPGAGKQTYRGGVNSDNTF